MSDAARDETVTGVAEKFAEIYRSAAWGGGSGPGSDPYFSIEYRAFLEKFMRMNGVRSVVDFGCGDWQFSRFLDLTGIAYLGLDVVGEVIAQNRRLYAREGVAFEQVQPGDYRIPAADLLVVKDVLQHLPDAEIARFAREVLPRFRFALVSNSFSKVATGRNHDIAPGEFRTLDLTAPPYNWRGAYVLEFAGREWEHIRTLLVSGAPDASAPE